MLNMVSLLIISVGVGFLGSLTGLGGASILTPILVFMGIPVKEAIACGMVAIIATSSGSASAHIKEGIINVRIAMYLQMFTVAAAIAGATVTAMIPPVYLYFFFAAFLLTAFAKIRSIGEEFTPSANQDRLSCWLGLNGSYFDRSTKKTVEYRVNHALAGGLGMAVAGFAAGMLGIGSGVVNVTLQEHILKMPPKVSSATSNFIIGITALAGASVYLFSGLLNVTLLAPMAVGTTIGAIIGGRMLNRISNRRLRILFYVLVAFLIVQMLYKGVTAL